MRTFKNEQAAIQFLGTIPWGTAAGVCRTHAEAVRYASTGITMTGYGSIIEEKGWGGNPGDVYQYDGRTGISINNIGLGDPGIEAHLRTLPNTKLAVEGCRSQLWVSYSGRLTTEPHAYRDAARRLVGAQASSVNEGNTACGNILLPSGKRKKPICLDLPLFDEVVSAWTEGSEGVPTAIKVGPTTDADLLGEWVRTCLDYGVDYLVFANTIPNGNLLTDDFKPAVAGGRGGIGGAALEPFVSAMLRDASPLVKGTKLKLIATGGISCGLVAYKYLRLGTHGFGFNSVVTRPGSGGPNEVYGVIFGNEESPGLATYLVEHGLPEGPYA